MSTQKDEIIGKQRRIAELMGRRKESKTPPQLPNPAVQDGAKKARQQRPTLKRPSTSSVLAAARAQAAASRMQEKKEYSPGSDLVESPKLRRKTKSVTSDGRSLVSSLATLVQTASKSSQDDYESTTLGANLCPDDFWKNIREWNFVGDLRRQQQARAEAVPETLQKPIPNTFINVRHYVSVWGPKILAEARAQILSELTTDFRMNKDLRDPFVLVNVDTSWVSGFRDRSIQADLMDINWRHVQLKTKLQTDLQFWGHDLCALIPVENKDTVESLLRGREVKVGRGEGFEDSFSNFGMICHTTTQRREVNGLILKVSKRKWAQMGTKEMFLLKIGSSITSLREFTALCKVATIPLQKSLLGNLLEKEKNRITTKAKSHRRDTLVEKMGGAQALGKGFAEYVQKKFNPSQLKAISAASQGYGDGGITLIKGPPGTGKTTMLVAVLNSLHIRQYNKYYEEVRQIAAGKGICQTALELARKAKPRLLVCAPSNAGIDNVILRIMEDGFVDGSGQRYNPSMIRVGVGQSSVVRDVALQTKVDQILSDTDLGQLERSIAGKYSASHLQTRRSGEISTKFYLGFRMELQRINADIMMCRRKIHAIANASKWPLGRHWEIRVDEECFDSTGRVFFVNHREQTTTYECPPPPEPDEIQFLPTAMPEYRAYMSRIVKLIESYFSIKSNLEQSTIVKGSMESGANHIAVKQALETHVLNSVHIVMTTLGSAGSRVFEAADRFEVVVVDEAAQSVEPATLAALQLGSRHCVLVGDPQQLPATIFNVTGRSSKYDRSLFQRLEEAGQQVFMLNEQYRMHPQISHFPRTIFYGGNLHDGPNVRQKDYGNPLRDLFIRNVPILKVEFGSPAPCSCFDATSKLTLRLAVHSFGPGFEGAAGRD
eukprot:scaffold10571_cov154-Cylindrotheca_fusiformis.AAC.3